MPSDSESEKATTISRPTPRKLITSTNFTSTPDTHRKLLALIKSPEKLIKLNPLVIGFEERKDQNCFDPPLSTDRTFVITDKLPLLGQRMSTSTTFTASFRWIETGGGGGEMRVCTRAPLGVRTLSVWTLESGEDGGEDEEGDEEVVNVQELWELLSVPWGLEGFVMRTSESSHRVLFSWLRGWVLGVD
jgi:hypothetical protein